MCGLYVFLLVSADLGCDTSHYVTGLLGTTGPHLSLFEIASEHDLKAEPSSGDFHPHNEDWIKRKKFFEKVLPNCLISLFMGPQGLFS